MRDRLPPSPRASGFPRRVGRRREAASLASRRVTEPLEVRCPTCWAAKGEACLTTSRKKTLAKPHGQRCRKAEGTLGVSRDNIQRASPPSRSRSMRPSPKASERKADHADRMAELVPQVLARAGYRCQRCGAEARPGRPLEAHHRLMRSQGGPDTMENLVCLCGPNPAGCHGWCHSGKGQAEARRIGLLLPASGGPPSEPWEGLAS